MFSTRIKTNIKKKDMQSRSEGGGRTASLTEELVT